MAEQPDQAPSRVFDNPNHPQYGPVRRMWIILAQLDLLTDAEHLELRKPWDQAIAFSIGEGYMSEAAAQRQLLRKILGG